MVGHTLLQYHLLELIGVGGMGEVYRAADTRLGRDVAVKILPPAFARDSDRLARFEREARALAALNHPHIASLHGLEESGGLRFLVMEYVPGASLTGPLSLEEALPLLVQVAGALEASHEKGIIHRDLKPANIRVTPDGRAKVLDFGLAKAAEAAQADDSSLSPTVGADATREGTILGTAAYMSPEQLRGRPADRRADIWSFGCLFYEVLTGRQAFHGETASDTAAAILRSEANWSALPAATPESVRALLRRCLQKDPLRRIRDMGDVRLEIETALEELKQSPATSAPLLPVAATRHSPALIAITGVLVVIAAAGAWWLRGTLATSSPPARTVEVHRLTDLVGIEGFPAISPDGKSVALVADDGSYPQIWVRLRSGGAALQLTRDPYSHLMPRWSPDSTTLIYYSAMPGEQQGAVWEIPALGGSPRRITSSLGGCDMSHDGDRVACFRLGASHIELTTMARDGSDVRVVAELPRQDASSFPRWSPDDRWIAFLSGFGFGFDIWIVPSAGGEVRKLTSDSAQMAGLAWLPDGSGLIYSTSRGSTNLYVPAKNLWQQSLDGSPPQQVTFGAASYLFPDMNAAGLFVASQVNQDFNIWKFPVDGSPHENVKRAIAITHQTARVQTPSVSPDEREVAYLSDVGGQSNLWVMNLQTREARQVTNEQDPGVAVGVMVWAPDGKYITYYRRRAGQPMGEQWIVQPDGSGLRQITDYGGWGAWSPDSQWLYWAAQDEKTRIYSLYKLNVATGERVTVRTDDAQSPSIGRDGSLYYVKALGAINGLVDLEMRVARPDNAESRLLGRIPGARIPEWQLLHPVLSPDDEWLAVMLTDGVTTNLWGISTRDGSFRQFTDFGGKPTLIARRVSWSPDGRYIYAAVGEGDGDVVLLEGLLPPR